MNQLAIDLIAFILIFSIILLCIISSCKDICNSYIYNTRNNLRSKTEPNTPTTISYEDNNVV